MAHMESNSPTLTEFLLARIADDEAQIRDGLAGLIALSLATRVLADCAAKRRIIELYSVPDPHATGESCPDCETLRLLALPYAAHPDYQAEWRP